MNYDDRLNDEALRLYAGSMTNRARSAGARGTLTADDLRDCILNSGGRCAWCATSVVGAAFEIDHIIPISNGGGNTGANLALSCPDCNRAKSAKHPARFAQEIYARTGVMTALLRRVLEHYEVDAVTQRGLFDDDDDDLPEPDLRDEDSDSPDDPPPYVWGKS